MENQKKIILSIIGIIIVFLIAIMAVFIFSKPIAEEVYKNNLQSIVELKASSEDVGDSYGTAVFIDNDGTLVTNAHVVTYKKLDITYEFEILSIRFAAEKEYREVELVKFDESLDIAVLKLKDFNNANFKSVKIGRSDKLKSGQKVYAMGNSINYGISISEGIIGIPLIEVIYEKKARMAIQCSLNITEGNSGGALLDEKGALVGITTFRIKDSKGNVVYGLAYSVPINLVCDYVSQKF